MANTYTTSSGEPYYPGATYKFTDKDGNTFYSKGDNGYVWQSMSDGIPISVNDSGEWYTEPYLDVTKEGYVAHIPNWFKDTQEYTQWQTYSSQIPNLSVNTEVYNNLKSILKSLGSQGAVRTSLNQDLKRYDKNGIFTKEMYDKYVKSIVDTAAEGQGGGKAQLKIWGKEYESAADFAREYKNLSKEDLSSAMTKMYKNMDLGANGKVDAKDAQFLADTVTAAKILNYIDDNYISYGNDNEFKGLLSSSVWQQINRGLTQFMGGVTSNTFVGIPARVAYGIGQAATGNGFDMRIEDLYSERLATGADLGANLEGNESADVIGMWGGAIGSIAVTMSTSMMMGSAINGAVAGTAPGGFLSKVGAFAQTLPGAAVSDFFLNDLPLDLIMFTTDSMRDGIGKAWYDPENPQPLFGIPFIRQASDGNFYPSGIGPDVPGGLVMNMVGDAILDAALPVLGIMGNATFKGLDRLTGGAVTRAREKAAVTNLRIQNALTSIPIIGDAWKKFINHMMGAENAQYIREARKAAIAQGSMEPYVRAQNLLTLANHSGLEVVGPLFRQLDEQFGISKAIKEFQANKNNYGGIGETRVDWKEIKRGVEVDGYKAQADQVPRQVKQGLLDVERLSELRGEQKLEGDLLPNPAREKEIAEIEARLEKTPQAIKDFAQQFSDFNKAIERMGVDLGVTRQEWLDALQLDPRWESYMTRQALIPGDGVAAGGVSAPDAKILNAKRKGYYANNYIDPTLAINLKVEALGRAFAWNERAKSLVSFEIAQGKLVAGKGGVEAAARLAEVKEQIKSSVEYRKSIGYDETLGRVNADVDTISTAFRKVNDLLNLPDKLNLKSVYEATQNPRIKEFVSNFNNGKIRFDDGVKEAAGLSDSEAVSIIQNTCVQKGDVVVERTYSDVPKTNMLFEDAMVEANIQQISEGGVPKGLSFEEQLEAIRKPGNDLFNLKNKAGEVDFGVFGITPWKREKYIDDLKNQLSDLETTAKTTQEKARNEWLNKKLKLLDEELKATLKNDSEKLADIRKRRDELIKNEPELKTTYDYPEQNLLRAKIQKLESLEEYGAYNGFDVKRFVDSDNTLKFSTLKGVDDNDINKLGFQGLTNGETRRALFQKGYDNLTPAQKQRVDKADKAFTQRLSTDMILYRGEPTDGGRTIKVGEPFDMSSWTYTSVFPAYTDMYSKDAITSKVKNQGNSVGTIYRIHAKEGTPIYAQTKGLFQKGLDASGESSEFVLPRDMKATIIGVTKDKTGFFSNKKVATIVDVELDPNSGYTPKLSTPKKIAEAADVPDTAGPAVRQKIEENAAKLGYNAGVTAEGIPYKYTVENGKITSFERIETSEDYAAVINTLGGVFNIDAGTIDKIGKLNAEAINRTILYYRDNMPNIGTGPTYHLDPSSGSFGYIWPATYTSQYGWKVVNGHIEADQYNVYLGHFYKAGNEKYTLEVKAEECASGRKPKNTATLESTPVHEGGHSMMMQMAVHRLNRMIDEGVLKLDENVSQLELGRMIENSYDDLHALLLDKAMKKIGYEKYTEADITREANTISEYASSTDYGLDEAGRWKHDEIFSEAQRMYNGNGQNSSRFCLAIVEAMKEEAAKYTTAAAPALVFEKNNLTAPKGLFKGDEYAFPAKAKTSKQKGKWLDEWRQKNPYLKGKGMFTEEQYQMANLWDTFFQKEIRAFDPNSKTAMPDALAKKNGDFLADLADNAAKKMVTEIRKASVEGFSQKLATMVLSRNSSDVAKAMDEFIIGRVNKAADELAAKMPGGATAENVNVARVTLWSEDNMKNDFINLLGALSPDIDSGNINSKITELFDTQAKGYASIEALPVDVKKLIGEREELTEKLYRENKYARGKGREVDGELENYRGDVTQVVHYKENGEDVYVVVNDPCLADVLKKPTDYKETNVMVETIAQASNFISRAYRIGTTGINPIAFVRNVLRDPMQATIQGGFNPFNIALSPEAFYHTLRGFGLDNDTITKVTNQLATWAGAGTLTAEMKKMGYQNPNSKTYRSRVEQVTKQANKLFDMKILEKAEAPLEAWESTFRNQVAQQSFVKNYQRYGDVNRAMGMAMFDASNSTTNFSHSVGFFKRATSTVPYLSSAINGTRSFWTQFNINPIGMITRITAGFMVPAMAITAWNLSDPERRERYMSLPEWYRQTHLVLIDLEGNCVAFPIPEEIEQYYGTARKLIELTQEATPYSLEQILAQGAFGFLPVDTDGYFGEDGKIDWERGTAQLLNGLMPQAATAIYEFFWQKDMFTGQDLSNYSEFQKWLNLGTNVFGTVWKNVVNDIGMMLNAPEDFRLGKTTADTLARDLFGIGFDNAKSEFMNLVGSPSEIDPTTGKETEATGLFAKNEKLQKQIQSINSQIAYADESKKAELEEQKQKMIDDFANETKNLVYKYMSLYTQTGGLEEWQKEKIVKVLTLGGSTSSAVSGSYQSADSSQAYLNERALAQQRYVGAGLPAGPSLEAIADNGSIELQAAINKFYGVNKQATQDYKNAVDSTNLKDIRDEFYNVINQIYDAAEEQGKNPDYDLIEKIQARYLQAVDNVLIPIINKYGINVLNNNDFIDAVRRQVNGMIPSDDWRQSTKNAKKFLSTKEFPTATVDVKKWLKQRYSSGMRDRNIGSDDKVTQMLEEIKKDIDAGNSGSARSKINSLKTGINKANYYISAKDFQLLTQYSNMVK